MNVALDILLTRACAEESRNDWTALALLLVRSAQGTTNIS